MHAKLIMGPRSISARRRTTSLRIIESDLHLPKGNDVADLGGGVGGGRQAGRILVRMTKWQPIERARTGLKYRLPSSVGR